MTKHEKILQQNAAYQSLRGYRGGSEVTVITLSPKGGSFAFKEEEEEQMLCACSQ